MNTYFGDARLFWLVGVVKICGCVGFGCVRVGVAKVGYAER